MSESYNKQDGTETKKQLCLAGVIGSLDSLTSEKCSECGNRLIAKMAGGVKCSKVVCGYWFCY